MDNIILIKKNIETILNEIKIVCDKKNTNPDDIKLVGVTKTISPEMIKIGIDAGLKILGENKIQEAIPKIQALGNNNIEYHFIGHLQSNKAKLAVQYFQCIQSVDSVHLAGQINKYAKEFNKIQDVFIEINIGGEDSKYGIKPDNIIDFIQSLRELNCIKIRGLMTIAPYFDDTEKSRECFKRMNVIYKDCKNRGNQENVDFKYLSMGMSNDFKVAIEEAANMVRIGTAIWGERRRVQV